MLEQNKNKQKKEVPRTVPEWCVGFLLLKLLWWRGLEAWLDNELAGIVWVRCEQGEIEQLLESAQRAVMLVKVRWVEAVAKAVFSAGRKPSKHLKDALELAQGRYVMHLFEENGN